MKRPALLLMSLVLLGSIAMIWMEHRARVAMQETVHSMETRVDALAGKVTSLQEQQQRFAALTRATPEQDNVTAKLAGLTAKVAQLQNRLAQTEQVGAGISKQIAAARGPDIPFVYPDATKRSDYAFTGYTTPQSGIQSVLWAIIQSDARTFQQSLTGTIAEAFSKQFEDLPEGVMPGGFRNGAMFKATGFRVLEETSVAEDEMLLKVFLEGSRVTIKPVFKRVGGEWKWARNEN